MPVFGKVGRVLGCGVLLLACFSAPSRSQTPTDPSDLLPFSDEYGPSDPLTVQARNISRTIGKKLGHRLRRPIVIIGDYPQSGLPQPVGLNHGGAITLAASAPMRPIADAARPGHRKWVRQRPRSLGGSDSQMHTCVIGISIHLSVSPPLVRTVQLAHEILHCYQWDMLTFERMINLPDWIKEGTAQFVGEDYGGAGSTVNDAYWQQYLTVETSLYDRSYDAMGFFFHLKERGADPYPIIRMAILRGQSSSDVLRRIRTSAGDRVFSTWPTSLARRNDLGAEWNISVPGVGRYQRRPTRAAVSRGTPFAIGTDPAEQKLIDLSFPHQQVLRLEIRGYGGLRWNHEARTGRTQFFAGSLSGRYCVRGTCRCPDGSLPEGVTEVPGAAGPSKVLVGLSGAELAASISATVQPPDCARPKASCRLILLNDAETSKLETSSCGNPSLALPACLKGSWKIDPTTYESEMRRMLPPGMRILAAENRTVFTIDDDGVAQSCIDFSARTRRSGPIVLETNTVASGASVAKLGLTNGSTLCSKTIKEEVEAVAKTKIGDTESKIAISVPGVVGTSSRFKCSGNELILYTKAGPVGEIMSRFQRLE